LTALLVDSSVLIKWFHREGESEVAEARAILNAHLREEIEARIIELGLYEVGNVLLTSLHWKARDVSDQLGDLISICGTPLFVPIPWLYDAARLSQASRLTFYDAAWAAAARALRVALVSSDKPLQRARLAESPTEFVRRLRLPRA
jgi:predicted nucleic acid-binding protein